MAELALNTEGCAVTKTGDLENMMRARFLPPEWALFFEIYAGTGYAAGGRADAVAMNLYPSRGLLVHGFELKVSRADWLKELKQPEKAETIFRYCDHWWLVVGDRAIVKPGELPEPWGLIAPRGEGLAIATQAPKLKPRPLDREFIAVLARRANSMASESIQDRVDAATAALTKDLETARGERDELRRVNHTRLAEQVAAFERSSGINIADPWRHGSKVGEIVKVVMQHGFVANQRSGAKYALGELDRIRKDLSKLLDALPKEADG